jgi:hypothetical protein
METKPRVSVVGPFVNPEPTLRLLIGSVTVNVTLSKKSDVRIRDLLKTIGERQADKVLVTAVSPVEKRWVEQGLAPPKGESRRYGSPAKPNGQACVTLSLDRSRRQHDQARSS